MRLEESFLAYIVQLGRPMIQRGDVWNQPFPLPQLGVVRQELAADWNAIGQKLEFGDLLHRIISSVEKRQVHGRVGPEVMEPARNDVMRKTKKRCEPMHRFGCGRTNILQHLIVDGLIGFDPPQVAFSVLLQRLEQMQSAAASEPRAHLEDNLREVGASQIAATRIRLSSAFN